MSDSSDLSLRAALSIAVRVAVQGLSDGARHARAWFWLSTVLFLLQALVPAAEVWLLKHLVVALSAGTADSVDGVGGPGVAAALAGLTVVVGLNFPLGQIAVSSAQRMGFRLHLRYSDDLGFAAARLSPIQLADVRVVTDLEAANLAVDRMSAVPGNALQLVGTLITSAGLFLAICSFDVVAGLFVLAALVPTVIAFTFMARLESARWPAVAAAERRARYATEQLLQQRSSTELAVFGSGAKVAAIAARHRRSKMAAFENIIGSDMRWEAAASLGTAALLAGALLTLVGGGVSAGLAAAAIAGILSGLSAVRFTGHAFGNIVSAAPHARSYQVMLHRAPVDRPHPITQQVDKVMVEGLTVTYPGAARAAVTDISLHAERGEIVALVGVNGAGKTTTVNALLGVIATDSGHVTIDGLDTDTMTEQQRMGCFALLTQEFGRFEFTIREALSLGTPAEVGHDDAAIWDALHAARLETHVRSLPDGLDTQLGQQWGGIGLSGGQWQRLALARVYLRNAGVWVLDEPTSAIDAEAEQEIFAELQRTKADRITIVVSHRAWTLKGMDRIHVFDQGRIVQTGSYGQLLQQAGRFAEIFSEQVQTNRDGSPLHA